MDTDMDHINSVTPSGHSFEVAHRRRSEQNRDAMPSPEEAKELERKHLRETGCKVCDENDPDELVTQKPTLHECSAHQSPPEIRPEVVCKDHKEPVQDRLLDKLREKVHTKEDYVAGVLFTCGMTEVTEPAEQTDEAGHPIPPRHRDRPSVPVRCRCGAEIDELVYPEH